MEGLWIAVPAVSASVTLVISCTKVSHDGTCCGVKCPTSSSPFPFERVWRCPAELGPAARAGNVVHMAHEEFSRAVSILEWSISVGKGSYVWLSCLFSRFVTVRSSPLCCRAAGDVLKSMSSCKVPESLSGKLWPIV